MSAEMPEAQCFRHFFFYAFCGWNVGDNEHSIRAMLLA